MFYNCPIEENNIPIALHLDHGPDFETAKMCIDNGFTSVVWAFAQYIGDPGGFAEYPPARHSDYGVYRCVS